MKTTEKEAEDFFIEFFDGKHHFPSQMKPCGLGWSVVTINTLATFDFSNLTKLVALAHLRCFRAEIYSGGINKLKIAIWKRQRTGSMAERHPTLSQGLQPYLEMEYQETLKPD